MFGTTGAGKTTLATQIAREFSMPLIDMDSLRRTAKGTENPFETFTSLVNTATQGDFWVMDGCYTEMEPIAWLRAEAILWLDCPLPNVVWGLFKRSLQRIYWGMAKEKSAKYQGAPSSSTAPTVRRLSVQRRTFDYLTAILTYSQRKRDFFSRLYITRYRHLHIIRVCNYQEARRWVEFISAHTEITSQEQEFKPYENPAHH